MDPLIVIEYIRTSVEIIINMNQKPAEGGESGLAASARVVPKDYEEIIQKLEGDVRSHIRVEQQMRLHIENIQDKLEHADRARDKTKSQYKEEMQEVKREKRRLDDLLTIREKELAQLANKMHEKELLIGGLEAKVQESKGNLEKKVRSLEKKYENTLANLFKELQ